MPHAFPFYPSALSLHALHCFWLLAALDLSHAINFIFWFNHRNSGAGLGYGPRFALISIFPIWGFGDEL